MGLCGEAIVASGEVARESVSENWRAGGRFSRHWFSWWWSSVFTAGRGNVPDSAMVEIGLADKSMMFSGALTVEVE
jgi:hypothetical protein